MRRSRFGWAVFFTGTMLLSACSSGSNEGGSGGSAGTGGAHGSGGATGSGGHVGSGGTTGSGGSTATGGTTGSGGSTATGGTTGSGGGTGSGGSAAAGGGSVLGGASGSAGGAAGGSAGGGGDAGAAGGGNAGGNAGGAGGGNVGGAGGGHAGGAGGAAGAGGAGGGAPVDPVAARGEYLVKSVLGCAGCHTPSGGAALSGSDCFVKNGTSCLSSPNLTNDDTGLKKYTKQQIEDAFRLGKDPDDSTKYLFATMPYYQFANVSDDDADAIVAYLRTVSGISHQVQANTAPYDVQPSAPENAPVAPANLPAASPAAGPSNGKYLATLLCVTCHTPDATGTTPKIIDATKAFQGGISKMVQTSNLTPDATGLMTWNVSQVATAITSAKNKTGATICGMRALANMTTSDATDIGSYLLSIPPVVNALTITCQSP